MLKKRLCCLLPALIVWPAYGPAPRLGGWAVITVENLPERVVAGEATRLAFTVRQHGHTPLTDLRPQVEVQSGGRTQAKVAATAAGPAGQYAANVTLPRAGEWTITIHSGFGTSRVTLLPVRAVDAGTQTAAMPVRERGRHLFVAKGCITCHVHEEAKGEVTVAVGPELTGRRYPAEYLARFLANPAIAATGREVKMPDLGLKPQEIAALVAFVNTDRQLSERDR